MYPRRMVDDARPVVFAPNGYRETVCGNCQEQAVLNEHNVCAKCMTWHCPCCVRQLEKTKPMIEKSLTLSTGHMPSTRPDFRKLRFGEHDFGYILFVAAVVDLDKEVPGWLRPIYAEALDLECTTVNFDSDASEIDRFKLYEW